MSDLPKQQELISNGEWDVILWLDGGRYDVFEDVHGEYLDGNLERVYNGGYGFTKNWTKETFDGHYDATFFHGGQPISEMISSEYEAGEHFNEVVPASEYEWDNELSTCKPEEVWRVFRENYDDGRAVIRFLQPHPPLKGMVEYTRGKNRVNKITKGIISGDITEEDVMESYIDSYRWVLSKVQMIARSLEDKNVVITADHGELIGERGMFFHGPNHPKIPELVEVPWFEVGQ